MSSQRQKSLRNHRNFKSRQERDTGQGVIHKEGHDDLVAERRQSLRERLRFRFTFQCCPWSSLSPADSIPLILSTLKLVQRWSRRDLRSTRTQGEGQGRVSLEVRTHEPRILNQNICLGPVVGIKYYLSETYR